MNLNVRLRFCLVVFDFPEVKVCSTISNNTYGGAIFGYAGAISMGRLYGRVQKLRFANHH